MQSMWQILERHVAKQCTTAAQRIFHETIPLHAGERVGDAIAEPSRSNSGPWADERGQRCSQTHQPSISASTGAPRTHPVRCLTSLPAPLRAPCSPAHLLGCSSCFIGRTTAWKFWLSTSSHCSTCALSVGATPYKLGVPCLEYLSQMYRMIALDSATISTFVVMSDCIC